MLELSPDALKELNEYFKDKEKGTIRIYLAPGGCSGPRLALALDEVADDDKTEEIDGFKFCINGKLADEIGSAKIDLGPLGFDVIPANPLPQSPGGSACGGCCGGCGH